MDHPDARSFQRALAIALALVPPLLAMYLVAADDGLRHVAIAFGPPRSWGGVYPYSEFARFSGYDPWWGYDAALRALGALLAPLPLDRLARQLVGLKLLSASFVGASLWLMTRRSRVAHEVSDAPGFAIAILMISIGLAEPLIRFASVRPFAFGTLWLVYCVRRTGTARGFVSAVVLTALYPYLAWPYLFVGAVAHLWRGSRSFALGAMAGALVVVGFRPADFAGLVLALGHSATVRAQVASSIRVSELVPLWNHLRSPLLVLFLALWLVPRLDREARRLKLEHVIALCFLPLSLVLARYFVDVVIPLLFVAHAADVVRIGSAPVGRLVERMRDRLGSRARRGPTARSPLPGPTEPASLVGRRALAALLAVAYAALLGALCARTLGQHERFLRVAECLRPIPRGSRVLTEFSLQYRILYARPDLSIIPSSELGFPQPDVAREYVAYMNQGRACTLAGRTGVSYLVDTPSHHLSSDDRGCLSLVRDDPMLRIWRVARDAPGARQRQAGADPPT